jgi:hypothetical protein
MFRKLRTITATYVPVEWGIKVQGEDIIAWARLSRTNPKDNYLFYGDDADCYEAFEEDGFTISAKVKDFKEADKWIKEEVFGG